MFDKFSSKKRKTGVRLAEDPVCKICLDSDCSLPVVHPCKCQGSIYYVHQECLKAWILSNYSDIDQAQCELCKHKYSMSYSIGCVCNAKPERCSRQYSCLVFKLFLFLIFLILTVCFICMFSEAETKINLVLGIFFSVVGAGIVLVFVILVYSLVKCFSTKKINKWKILDYSGPDPGANDTNLEHNKEVKSSGSIRLREIEVPSLLLNGKTRRVKTEEKEVEPEKHFCSNRNTFRDSDDFTYFRLVQSAR